VKRIQFTTTIKATPAVVWRQITSPDSYRKWTSAFAEGSYFRRLVGNRSADQVPGAQRRDFEEHMTKAWPQALARLKELSESTPPA
jgi:hypothetical protein